VNFSLLTTPVGRLRVVAFLEGCSFLLLLGVAMPLKYLAGQPAAVRQVGMAHGILFVLYVLLLLQNALENRWSPRKVLLALLASLIPLGTFYADRHLFRPQ
jgi:integral membrane protein